MSAAPASAPASAPAPAVCWSCRSEITDGRCECSPAPGRRVSLLLSAFQIVVILASGFVLAYAVVGAWRP